MSARKLLIPLVMVALALLANGIGGTHGAFSDPETSGGNTFTAWTSTAWIQTTQADFNAGVLSSVNTSASPGDVKLATVSGWYSAAWGVRRPVTVSNSTISTLSNFQVKVTVTYDSDMQPDFDDIRFTDDDGTTLLSYWRESYTASTSAVFWVKVPSIRGFGTATVYMYYGNPAADTASNGSATFLFFDDFSGTLSQWTIDSENTDSKVYIWNGALRHDPDSSQTKNSYFDTRIITNSYRMQNGVIEYDVFLGGSARIIHQLGWRVNNLSFGSGYAWRLQTDGDDGGYFEFSSGAWTQFDDDYPDTTGNVWHRVLETVNGNNFTTRVDGGAAYNANDSTTSGQNYLVSHVHGVDLPAASYVLVDNIRVRQYASADPTTSVGARQNAYVASGTIASAVLNTGVTNARWDGLFWEETLPAGTNITFEVRASNTSFAASASNATLAWISLGTANSPVITGLPSGRYKQWRATLTTTDTSKTPTLSEVRVYYTN